jgi:hypothetical protein
MTRLSGLSKKGQSRVHAGTVIRACKGRGKLRPHEPLGIKYLVLSVARKSGKPKLVFLQICQYKSQFDALANYRAYVAARSKWKKIGDTPQAGRRKKNDSPPLKCPQCAEKLDLIRRASFMSGLPWPAGTLYYECRRDGTGFFVVRDDDHQLIDLLDGDAWAAWVEEEYNPYMYEGGMVKVLKPKFAGLNLASFK